MFNVKTTIELLILAYIATPCACWQYFTAMADWDMANSVVAHEEIHSEYYFGLCNEIYGYSFYTHQHLDHIEVLGKIIIRGWINVPRMPTCIILRAKSYSEDLFRSTSYNFQMCTPRIAYCHTHRRTLYFYYEWYIPTDMNGGCVRKNIRQYNATSPPDWSNQWQQHVTIPIFAFRKYYLVKWN